MTWYRQFRVQLDDVIGQDRPSLQVLARRLTVSTRTLQRRLAEHGTTWRAELETARQLRAQRVRQAGPIGMTRLATHLSYADPRSARRAMRRWNDRSGWPIGMDQHVEARPFVINKTFLIATNGRGITP